MFSSLFPCFQQSNNLINKVHETSLRLVANDQNSSFETLLRINKDITVHERNLEI